MNPPLSEQINELTIRAGLSPDYALEEIHPEASSRRYYRLRFADNSESVVLCRDAGESSSSRTDFLSLTKLLAEHDVPVPKLLALDEEAGLILLADGGSSDLCMELRARRDRGDIKGAQGLISRALDILLLLQSVPPEEPVQNRLFDFQKLFWEMEFLRVQSSALAERLDLPSPLTRELRDRLGALCVFLSEARPLIFTHRDYHGRNILCKPNPDGEIRLTIIDYQDARLGTPWYDPASLLFDPYSEFHPDFAFAEFERYRRSLLSLNAPKASPDEKEDRLLFIKQAEQRLWKALGSYLYLTFEKGMKSYSRFIEPALARIEYLNRLDENEPAAERFIASFREKILPAVAEREL